MTAIGAILTAIQGVRDAIRDNAGPLDVLNAITPMLLEFAMSNQVLTPTAIAQVQDRVHHLLRGAGLLISEDLPE